MQPAFEAENLEKFDNGRNEPFAACPFPMAIFSAQELLAQVNRSWIELSARRPDYKLGQSVEDFISTFRLSVISLDQVEREPSSPVHASSLADLVATGSFELDRITLPDGRTLTLQVVPLPSGEYQIIGSITSNTDLTSASLREIIGHATDGFATFDKDQTLLVCNAEFVGTVLGDPDLEEPTGLEALEIARQMFANEVLPLPEGASPDQAAKASVASFFQDQKVETDVEAPDGRAISVMCTPALAGGHLMILRDVTDERNADQRSMTALETAAASLDEGFALFDAELKLVLCNDRYIELNQLDPDFVPETGTSTREFTYMAFDNAVVERPPDLDREVFADLIEAKIRNFEKNSEYVLTNGQTMLVSSNETPIGGALVTVRDVTSIKKAEIAGLEATSDVIQSLDSGIVLLDPELHYRFCNQRFLDLFIPGELEPDETWSLGSMIEELATINRVQLPEGLSSKSYADFIIDQTRAHARGVEMIMTDGTILEGSSHPSALGGYLLVFDDITERVSTAEELDRRRKAAFQNEKLSALGELLAGVAHELNNPLSIISGYAQVLAEQIDDAEQADQIGRIASAAERSAKIVKTFLAMARQKPVRMEPIDIAEVVEGALDVAAYGLRSSGALIIVRCPPEIPMVSADPDQLIQVLSNLIVNAEHALANKVQGATLRIEAKAQGDSVHLRVSDNGEGMTKDVIARIFEPFFTTKDVGIGTGFGLSFCHRIIDAHGGALSVESQPGEGSCFTIALPAVDSASVVERGYSGGQTHSLRILVVDDEPDVAKLLQVILQQQDHRVVCAFGPAEALDLAESESFDIVLSDMKMPKMTGDELYWQLVSRNPNLKHKVGFITGDSLSQKVREFLEDGERPFIEKPIQNDDLMHLVAKLANAELERHD